MNDRASTARCDADADARKERKYDVSGARLVFSLKVKRVHITDDSQLSISLMGDAM